MQDVTTLPFMRLIEAYGPPDYFFTEYFRVYASSRLEPHILQSITENPSDRPVFAQLIGEDIPHLLRTVRELQHYPVAGIDLNMGCPAPKVYKKNVGGGLLRDPARVDAILQALRAEIAGRFTVKMRVGFDGWHHYDTLLDIVNRNRVDLLSVHGRTVKQMYRPGVHYELIQRAVERANAPVLANGDVSSVAKAIWVQATTGCHGFMIGRHAIRNPWIFRQLREHYSGQPVFQPTLGDVRRYVDDLWQLTLNPARDKRVHLGYLKKFLNFTGQSVDPEGKFLKAMRRAQDPDTMWRVCDTFLVDGGRVEQPFAPEPYEGVIARPSREAPEPATCTDVTA